MKQQLVNLAEDQKILEVNFGVDESLKKDIDGTRRAFVKFSCRHGVK